MPQSYVRTIERTTNRPCIAMHVNQAAAYVANAWSETSLICVISPVWLSLFSYDVYTRNASVLCDVPGTW